MGSVIWNFARNHRAVTAIEYGLIAALIAMAVVAAIGIFGTDLAGVFSSLAGSI